MPWMARILERSSSNPSAARAACSSQPAARSGMPRCTDRYPSSRYAAAATRDAGRPGFRVSDCSDFRIQSLRFQSPVQEIGHLGAAAAGLMDQRPGQRDQGFGEQMMVAGTLRDLGCEA